MPERVSIRIMKESDLVLAGAWAAAESWTSETIDDFESFLAYDPGGCFILESRGEPAAVCIATRYGEKAFLGEMIVTRTARGLGLGPILFDRALRHLLALGCRSVSLDAVPKAASFYETRGFRTIALSLRCRGLIPASRETGVRPLEPADLPMVLTIDRLAFGADRSFFLRRRLAQYPELAWIRTDGKRIKGYIFGRRRNGFAWAGPWWSAEPDGGDEALLRGFALGSGDIAIQAGILDTNARAVELVRSLGFVEKPNPSRRMVMGAGNPVGIHPSLLAIGTAGKG
ncbi:MAG: GNAT family N-acetyltransferase [Acidobacteriota bacterium]|nr:GNAT family N-acetyltransferase [Acidobacteriota bacterium]